MKKIRVSLGSRAYDILIERDIIFRAAEFLRPVLRGKKLAIVTDENVAPHYLKRLEDSLASGGYDVISAILPFGEKIKSIGYLEKLYDKFASFKLTRTDAIVALGGGVVGDLTGFAASTFLRGVDFVQIPTTLLAQVDSSVGGKVAVNLSSGKNLVGSFYQPKAVLIDTACLETLEDRVFCDGMSEVIKYGCIRNSDVFKLLEEFDGRAHLTDKMEDVIFTCCNIKRGIVENDEFDTGERMLLNFGHTWGHVIEKMYMPKYTHGEAVAIGMMFAVRLGERSGITPSGVLERLGKTLKKHKLPIAVEYPGDFDLSRAFSLLAMDKKGAGESISFILLDKIGNAGIHTFGREELYRNCKDLISKA